MAEIKKQTSNRAGQKSGPLLDTRLSGTFKERYAAGKVIREKVPRESHAAWKAGKDRPSPVDLLIESSKGRLENLIPIRYGRMLQSPFTFYRGAAAIMASDLSRTPVSGITVQACGDCHLLNFGGFATPERRIFFDINDFDETLPGPWEWDLKRLTASFVIAGRNNDCSADECREMALTVASSYRQNMTKYATFRALDLWYEHIDFETLIDQFRDPKMQKLYRKVIGKARERTVAEYEFPKMTEKVDGAHRIRDDAPLIYHSHEPGNVAFEAAIRRSFAEYRATLRDDLRVLFDRYTIQDLALKVVGVGSVGTRCCVALFLADEGDPLFLQVKEARVAVFEPFVGRSAYANRGQRVVVGQRIMQSASDLFLGWTTGMREGFHFYIRQLRDMKIKPMVEIMSAFNLIGYATLCGQSLARAHAQSGDTARIAGYMGKGDAFDEAIADFSVAYANQNEKDFLALKKAVREGKVQASFEGVR